MLYTENNTAHSARGSFLETPNLDFDWNQTSNKNILRVS